LNLLLVHFTVPPSGAHWWITPGGMLRRAVDFGGDAEHPPPSTQASYGATASSTTSSSQPQPETRHRLRSNDDDSSTASSDDYSSSSSSEEEVIVPLHERLWRGLKTLVRVVANVENLWDSPHLNHQQHPPSLAARQLRRRNQYVVLFWFVVLASSYAGERSTFKLLVDRAGPFRLFTVQMITGTHILLMGTALVISYYRQRARFMALGVPLVDCVLMALLDSVALVLVFLTGAHVPPTLTVILVQCTIPLTAFFTQFIHPDGKFKCCIRDTFNTHQTPSNSSSPHELSPLMDPFASNPKDSSPPRTPSQPPPPSMPAAIDERLPGWGGLAAAHVGGSLILLLAVSLALCPAFYSIANPDFFIYADAIPTRTAINTLFFALSCFPAAASQLYKEHIFLQYRQPVNRTYLNFILSVFQFVFIGVAAPVLYVLQGLGSRGRWTKLYPASTFGDNVLDGLRCFFGLLDEYDQENKYPEDAECRLTLLLTILYVLSIVAVGVAVDKIVNAGATKVMYRGISAGIIVAVLSMRYYDMHITDFSYGPAIDALNLVCLVLLVLGAEVYHRASLQEATFETVYPPVVLPNLEDD
jgi:CRT-like, chloroquine-resistance transporter-like